VCFAVIRLKFLRGKKNKKNPTFTPRISSINFSSIYLATVAYPHKVTLVYRTGFTFFSCLEAKNTVYLGWFEGKTLQFKLKERSIMAPANPPPRPEPAPKGTPQPIKPGGGIIFQKPTVPPGAKRPPEQPPEGKIGGPESRG
jgi:hypothetical protein